MTDTADKKELTPERAGEIIFSHDLKRVMLVDVDGCELRIAHREILPGETWQQCARRLRLNQFCIKTEHVEYLDQSFHANRDPGMWATESTINCRYLISRIKANYTPPENKNTTMVDVRNAVVSEIHESDRQIIIWAMWCITQGKFVQPTPPENKLVKPESELVKKLKNLFERRVADYMVKPGPDGSVAVSYILRLFDFHNFDSSAIRAAVTENPQYFTATSGRLGWRIIPTAEITVSPHPKSDDWKELKDPVECAYGTSKKYEMIIKSVGLRNVGSDQIIFACPGGKFHRSSGIFVTIDMQSAMDSGIKFYQCENQIYSSGIDGTIGVQYIKSILHEKPF